jgi:carbon storage regulator
MLVLSRKPGDGIVIRDEIVVTVIDVRGGKVKLGVEAPLEIAVHRKEVYDRINTPREVAAAAPVPG